MTLNKAKGRMFKSVGWTWNPTGGCDHDCKYCYARKLTKGWGQSFEPNFREHFLKDKMPNDGSWVFVGSMGDLFCPGMKDEWILKILWRIQEEKGNNKFLLQTKNPHSFLAFYLEIEEMINKLILGTTIETTYDTPWSKAPITRDRKKYLATMKDAGFKTFLSLEPLADFNKTTMQKWICEIEPEAIEIGLENYTNYLPKPPEQKIIKLIEYLDETGFEYLLKDNLSSLCAELRRDQNE
jgi:DNA repair photolyase